MSDVAIVYSHVLRAIANAVVSVKLTLEEEDTNTPRTARLSLRYECQLEIALGRIFLWASAGFYCPG